MKRLRLLPAATVVLLAACGDKPNQVAPTEPAVPNAPSLSVSGDADASTLSSVCLVYISKRDALKAQLAADAANAELQERIASYDEYISDSCSQ